MILADLDPPPVSQSTVQQPPSGDRRSVKPQEPARDKAAVAALSPCEIAEMSHEELVQAVRCARLPFIEAGVRERLVYLDRPMLEQLVYLARRACRNQGY